ncbi:MAG: hypothetical protein ACYTGW_21595 [Planctomycetota bacterium]|jgi:hypothetical protein
MKAIPCILAAAFAVALSTGRVEAQNTGFCPSIGVGAASSWSSYPWNRAGSSVRVQYSYDANEVPGGGSIVISRIRFRPSDTFASSTTWAGGTYGGVTIMMSHGANASASLTTTFSANHGQNLATVFSGAVKLMPGSGTGSGIATNPYVDITLQKVFIYNPKTGPLLIDIASDGSKWVPNTPSGTVVAGNAVSFTTEGKNVARMYNLNSHTATTGSFQDKVGLVVELFYGGGTSNGLTRTGMSCSDGAGKYGAHFSRTKPTVGNGNFALEGVILPPGASALLIIGVNKNFQSIELGPYGASSCYLHADSAVELLLKTTTGSASAGTFNLKVPIPNNSALKGTYARTQLAVADSSSTRGLKVVFTNALEIIVQ